MKICMANKLMVVNRFVPNNFYRNFTRIVMIPPRITNNYKIENLKFGGGGEAIWFMGQFR